MRWTALIAAVAVLALAGCGGDNKESTAKSTSTPAATDTPASSGGGGQTVKLSADPSALKFNTTKLTAKAGKVTLSMANPSGIPHAVAVEGNGVDKDGKTVNKGGTSTVTADLKAGTYEFYCPVDGHKAAGMKGTLTVN
jgi:plastocyanin